MLICPYTKEKIQKKKQSQFPGEEKSCVMRRRWMYIRPEYMDLRGGCAKETAEYIDGILFSKRIS